MRVLSWFTKMITACNVMNSSIYYIRKVVLIQMVGAVSNLYLNVIMRFTGPPCRCRLDFIMQWTMSNCYISLRVTEALMEHFPFFIKLGDIRLGGEACRQKINGGLKIFPVYLY